MIGQAGRLSTCMAHACMHTLSAPWGCSHGLGRDHKSAMGADHNVICKQLPPHLCIDSTISCCLMQQSIKQSVITEGEIATHSDSNPPIHTLPDRDHLKNSGPTLDSHLLPTTLHTYSQTLWSDYICFKHYTHISKRICNKTCVHT